jgi:hypothetical protein
MSGTGKSIFTKAQGDCRLSLSRSKGRLFDYGSHDPAFLHEQGRPREGKLLQ